MCCMCTHAFLFKSGQLSSWLWARSRLVIQVPGCCVLCFMCPTALYPSSLLHRTLGKVLPSILEYKLGGFRRPRSLKQGGHVLIVRDNMENRTVGFQTQTLWIWALCGCRRHPGHHEVLPCHLPTGPHNKHDSNCHKWRFRCRQSGVVFRKMPKETFPFTGSSANPTIEDPYLSPICWTQLSHQRTQAYNDPRGPTRSLSQAALLPRVKEKGP